MDCNVDNIDAAARFRAAALGCPVDVDHPGSRDTYRRLATPPDQPMIRLQRVDHASRVHLDIEIYDIEAGVARLQDLGTTIFKRPDRWVLMPTPSGQRFGVVRVQRPGWPRGANQRGIQQTDSAMPRPTRGNEPTIQANPWRPSRPTACHRVLPRHRFSA